MRIGFIGLGIMGQPMAKNLLKAGHEVTVTTNRQNVIDTFVELGAKGAANAAEVAQASDIVITMLPNSPQVKQVALGPKGIAEGAHEGLIYVDMSSIAPIAAREVAAELAEKGIAMLDAPVSGGEPKAIDGTLSVMVGGDEDTFNTVKPVLETMASSVTRVGEVGAGNVAKLANQVIVAINIAAVAEALTLAQKAGVDPQAVFEAIRGGLAGSTVLEAKAPMMLDQDFTPGFRINLHIKDLDNVLDTGHDINAPLPLSAQVREMMSYLEGASDAASDHSALAKFYQNLAGITLGS
ncbi:MAG: 2-hydroxy-3-oxopropionate reductase [Actinomycetaceae bacterium]|nr:2-hydroxy-3-oxopropionate reductase [Actinomycetaceae bacterium]